MQYLDDEDDPMGESDELQKIKRLGYIVSHIPDRAHYTSRWKIYSTHPEIERYTAQSEDWIERSAERISRAMDVEKQIQTLSFYSDTWLEDMSVERYLFFLLYPTVRSILDGEKQISFQEVPLRHKTMIGIKSAYFQTLTITRNMSYHAEALVLEEGTEWLTVEPSYEKLQFRRGKGRELLRVRTDRFYVVCEGHSEGPVIEVPQQVEEQTRSYLYSTTKKIRFVDQEVYDTEMASYFVQTNAVHIEILKKVLQYVPADKRCVFPMDGVGLGYRIRPGSVSGDRSKHWLTHEDVHHEEAFDTIKRAQEGDVIVIMYGAAFLTTEVQTYLSRISNPVILVDAHYYPVPIRGVKVWGKTIWSYRTDYELPALPSDTITIEQTPMYSDNLLYLDEVIDVMEWTKTIAWYVQSQHAKVTSSLPWMSDFLKAIHANYWEVPGCPAYASYSKGMEDGRDFFFIPTGTMNETPKVLGLQVRYELEIGKVYRLPLWLAQHFRQHEDDYVWSSSEVRYTVEVSTKKRHSHIDVEFTKPKFGKIIRRDNVALEIQYKDVRGTFKKEDPDGYPQIARKLYGSNIPSSFREVMSAWYGGMPPQLFKVKKKQR